MGKTSLGREIERIREQRGMTQAALSRAVGVSKVNIHLAERGKTILRDLSIRRVAIALKVDPFPLLEMAAIDRGALSIRDAPRELQRLICRLAHREPLTQQTAAKLTAILDQELVAA